jgi:hypothetical protein
MIRPQPRPRMSGTNALHMSIGPFRLTAMIRCQSAKSRSSQVTDSKMAPLLTRISTRPSSASTRSRTLSTTAGSLISSCAAMAGWPTSAISLLVLGSAAQVKPLVSAPGRIRTRDPLLRRHIRIVAERRLMSLYAPSSCVNGPGVSPYVGRRLPRMAPRLAPRNLVTFANVRMNESSIDQACPGWRQLLLMA